MEPVCDQREKTYRSVDCGKGTFAVTGCEAAAVYNAMLFLGRPVPLQTVSDEFRILGIRWLNGRWGGYPPRIGRFFRAHGVPFRYVTRARDFLPEEDGVAVCSYWNYARRGVPAVRYGLHTVALFRDGKDLYVYNLNGGPEPRVRQDLGGIVGDGRFICAYLLPRRPASARSSILTGGPVRNKAEEP